MGYDSPHKKKKCNFSYHGGNIQFPQPSLSKVFLIWASKALLLDDYWAFFHPTHWVVSQSKGEIRLNNQYIRTTEGFEHWYIIWFCCSPILIRANLDIPLEARDEPVMFFLWQDTIATCDNLCMALANFALAFKNFQQRSSYQRSGNKVRSLFHDIPCPTFESTARQKMYPNAQGASSGSHRVGSPSLAIWPSRDDVSWWTHHFAAEKKHVILQMNYVHNDSSDCLVVSNMAWVFSIIYGMSSFPLTLTSIFQDGYCTTNQMMISIHFANVKILSSFIKWQCVKTLYPWWTSK